MLDPEERTAYGCRDCRDVGRVLNGHAEIDCPGCSAWDEERREQARAADLARRGEKPTLRESGLTAEEREVLAEWRLTFPRTSGLTLLLWIEGRRYDPAGDAEFLALAKRRLAKWRFLRAASNEGAIPSRLQHALSTGETAHLTEEEMDRLSVLGAEKRAA